MSDTFKLKLPGKEFEVNAEALEDLFYDKFDGFIKEAEEKHPMLITPIRAVIGTMLMTMKMQSKGKFSLPIEKGEDEDNLDYVVNNIVYIITEKLTKDGLDLTDPKFAIKESVQALEEEVKEDADQSK
jgi:hypothetical protein